MSPVNPIGKKEDQGAPNRTELSRKPGVGNPQGGSNLLIDLG